jgi:hypothetical protein
VNQTNHFFNLGYGWLCKHCSAERADLHHSDPGGRTSSASNQEPRLKQPLGLALAGWTDPTRQTLKCPQCGIEEIVNRA